MAVVGQESGPVDAVMQTVVVVRLGSPRGVPAVVVAVGLESGPVVVLHVGNRLAVFLVRTSNKWVDLLFDLIHSLPS